MSGNFTLDLSRFINRARSNVDLVTKKVVLDVARSVIRKSPVDTGRFKGNWMYGVGEMPSGTVDAFDDPTARITGQIPTQASGKLHYIVNNLPYSIRLENGWSSQAPAGMVGTTISEYQGIVRRAANEVNP